MNAGDAGWEHYWNLDDFWGNLGLWSLNARVFLDRADDIIEFTPHDVVLDIGSGPGELAFALAPRVQSVLAVDLAPQFVEMTRTRCYNTPNAAAGLMGDDYTDLSVFNQKFSLFLCISVVQYYKNIDEVEALIRSAQRVALPGARLLIGDLNLKRNRIQFAYDAVCSLLKSFEGGYARDLLRMAKERWLKQSDYRHVHAASSLLEFSHVDIEALVSRLGYRVEIVRPSLSIYANRPSLLVYFDEAASTE